MAFVTQRAWVCNGCGRQQAASELEAPEGWLHVQWWRTNGEVFSIDLCSPKCALVAEKILKKELSASSPPTSNTT